MIGQRRTASRHRRIVRQRNNPRPAALAVAANARFQIVAQRRRQRTFISRRSLHPIQRPPTTRPPLDCLGQRRRFAIQRRQCSARRRQRRFRRTARYAGALPRSLCLDDVRFRRLPIRLRHCLRLGRVLPLLLQRRSVRQSPHFAFQLPQIALGPFQPAPCRHQSRFGHAQLGLLARLLGHRPRQFDFSVTRRRFRLRHARRPLRLRRLRLGNAHLQRRDLARQPLQCFGSIMRQCPFTPAIFLQPLGLCRQIRKSLRRCAAFRRQRGQPMSRFVRCIARLLRHRARVRQRIHGSPTMRRRGHLRFLRCRHCGFRNLRLRLRRVRRCRRLPPARKNRARFGGPYLHRQQRITLRRSRLPPQRIGAIVHVAQNIVQPRQIGLRRAQFLLRIAPPHMQARNPCRFLQHRAPFLRARGDHGGDLALTDQSGTMRPRRRIGEDQRHVLGAHVAAIGAIGAACAAFDPANDFQLAVRADIDRGKKLALLLNGQQRNLGKVALGAGGGACEDHVLHAAAAHGFGARFAHHPPDRFQQVGLAAAIGADDARQPRLDPQFGSIDEAFETAKFQPPYLHDTPPLVQTSSGKDRPPRANQTPASLSFSRSTSHVVALSTTVPFMMKVGVPVMLYFAVASCTPLASFSASVVLARHCLP